MNKKLSAELKEKLEDQRKTLQAELEKFAEKDKNLKGDWDTKYPQLGANKASGSGGLEDAADEVQEYSNLLPIEHNLELRLADINSALGKIEKGGYGNCEKCGKKIEEERLKIYPEAKMCGKCQNVKRL